MRISNPLLFFFSILFLSSFHSSLNAQCGAGETYNTYCYDDGEVDVVAFEFCPTAGMIAQSTIIAGSYNATFPANIEGLTIYEGASGSGTSGTLLMGPVDGDLTGTVITASAPDLCLIFISNSNTFAVPLSCADGIETALEVCSESTPASNVTFTALADLCVNAGVQTGLSGGSPTGGVYSGSGVTDDGNGMTYSFDPAAAGVGVHTLTYNNGGSASDDVEVFALGGVSFTAPADLCLDAGIQTGLGGGSPAGGVYSGPGVTDDGNGTTYSFNPGIAGLGVHIITYTENGDCNESATDDIEVLTACSCPAPQTSHFHCSANGENDLVIFEICSVAGEFAQATINQGTYNSPGNNLTIYEGTSGSGTGGTILFGPQTGNLGGAVVTGAVADRCLIFVSNTVVGSCQDGIETALQVCGESIDDPIFFTAPGDLCINDGVQTGLSGGNPAGGVYSGPGVTDDGNGMTYSFDPAAAGVGLHTLTYIQSGNSASDDIEVFAPPTVTFTAPADLCIDAGIQTGLGGGLPVGGVYSGPGVSDNGNGLTYTFNPAIAGLGVHTITYTEGGICMSSESDDLEVTAACSCPVGETTYFNCYNNNEINLVIFEICPSAGEFSQADINQGVYQTPDDFLTIYQGASGSGTGGTIVFGPLNGNLAGNTIISSVVDECLIFVSNSGPIQSCADGLSTPLIVCGSSITSNVLFTALDDLSVNAGIQTGLSGGTPIGGVYSGPGVTDDGNGMTYTFNPVVAGIGVHTLAYTLGGNSASDDVEVLNLLPPSFSKSFSPTQIGPGSISTLTFTIENTASGTGLTDLAFTDNLPAGMTVASPAVITSNCGGTLTAMEGGTSISLSDGTLAPNSFCTISVNVTSSTSGTHTNTTGDLTSNAGNSGTASANLTVATNRPGFTKSFSPSSVNLGERSTLTLTIDNTANTGNILGITFTDNLPAGMVIANPSNATSTNTGIGTFTAVPGTNVISYNTTGFTEEIAAGGVCTFTVDVIGTTAETLDNVTDNLTVRNNLFQLFDCGKAGASLEVQTPSDILIQKSFTTNPVSPGGTTNLEFTITNLDRDFEATNISFTDDLSSVLAGLVATGTPLNDICGTGAQLSGTTLLTFTGGTIPANGSCTFSVPVQVPAGAAIGTYTNVTSNITADINGSTITGDPATENLYVANVPTFTNTFLNDPVPAGGTTTLEFTISNNSLTSALTDITFTDVISDFISGTTVTSLPAGGSCGAGSIFFTNTSGGDFLFQMTGGQIAAGSSCTFSIDLTIPDNVGAGTYTNTTGFLSGTIDGGTVNADPASDDLTVLAIPQLAKSFTDDPVDAGDIVNLEFTISYDEFATGDATSISFTDDLNAVIPGLAAVGLPLNDVCGTGSSISGTTNLTFSGGTLSPGGTCTFSVPVQIPAGVVTGAYTNTTSNLSATVGGQSASGTPATDDLDIGGFNFTKEFLDDSVIPGQLTTLRFTFENTSTFDATSIVFTDNLSSVISGLTTEGVLPTGAAACNAPTVTGTTFFIYSGGSVPAGTTCSFDIPVRVPASATSGTYNNVTSNLTVTIDGATRVLNPAIAPLVVNNNLISLTKIFTDDPVNPGGTVNVEYTLTNLDPVNAISNIAFTNDFDGALTGLTATGLPMSVCGGTVSGTGLLSFTGGSLAAGASCTFSVTLQTPASTPYGTVINCITSGVTGEINGLPVIGDPAFDDLQFQALQLEKSITGPVIPGEETTITFTITNSDPVNQIDQITFSDDLDAFISGMVATALPPDGSCGPLSEITGTSLINFGRGRLEGGESCSFDITVLVPCGTADGTYTNTTSTISGDGPTGGIVAPEATATLTVNAEATTFTALADLCINDGVQAGLGGGTPTGGVYSGSGVTDNGNGMTYSFDPVAAGVGVHTITYTVTNVNGCINSASDDVEVFAIPAVTFTALADLCINDGVQAGLGGGTPTGGVYSGPGVTDDGNGMTFSFDPAAAGVGTHTLTYTYTSANGCTDSASDDVEVFALPVVSFTAPADLCVDAGVQAGLGGGTPTGGVYSGTGVTDDGNGMTYSFDPAAAGAGVHTITYTVGVAGCTDSASDDVEIFALPNLSLVIPANQDEYCVDDPTSAINLAGSPTGGIYSGPGVTDLFNGITFTFNPAVAGVGTHMVTYTFTDANGCTGTATDNIIVHALPTVAFTAPADLCVNAGVQAGLGGGTPAGGVYSGTGVTDDGNGMTYSFDPAAAGVGTHTLTYTFTNANGCTNSSSDDIEVFALPTVTFTAPADLCVDAGVQAGLGGGTPAGGVYSGSGVTDDGNGMTYSFDPAAAGIGTHTIIYDFTNINGCSGSASDDVEIFALPVISFTAPVDGCIDGGVRLGMGQSTTPEGGVFSGPGVTDDGNGDSFTFDPVAAGAGVHILTYTFTDLNGCTNTSTDDIEIFALPVVTFTAPADLCVDAGVQAGLGGGSPTGGVYSGTGVIDDGNGMTYSFDPAAAGVGTHTLTYTFTDANGCTNSASDDIEVFALPVVMFTAPAPDVCVEDLPVTGLGGGLPSGGVYSGLGVTDDGNGMTFTFDPTASAPGGGNIPVTYTFTDANGCSNSATDDIFVNPVCCEFIATCPTVTDLGNFDCTQLDNIPAPPIDEATVEGAPYDIVIGDEPCGTIVVLSVDDINAPYDVCAMGGQTITRTITIFDDLNVNGTLDAGEESQVCTFTFDIVEDTTGPMISCPSDQDIEWVFGFDASDPNNTGGFASATDVCDPNPVITWSDNLIPGNCAGNFTIERTWTATDECGNPSMCVQTIVVHDLTNPIITCPADQDIEWVFGFDASDPNNTGGFATATDACDPNPAITWSDNVIPGNCAGNFTIERTWTATDECGNPSMCVQTIVVHDLTPPTFTVPGDITIECGDNPNDLSLTGNVMDASDACDPNPAVVYTDINNIVDVCLGGTINRTWIVTDECGNFSEDFQVITVNPPNPPTIVCPADMTVTCFEDIIADPNNAIATVGCPDVPIVDVYVTNPIISGIPGCDGTTYTYTYVVVDACGNTAECEQQFLLENSAPTVTVPADASVSCFEDITVSIDDITITDNCDGPLELNVLPPVIDGPANCPNTTYTYTYRVKDACNRVVDTERVFTILDNGGPVIIAPADFVSECEVSVNADNADVITSCANGIGYEVTVSGPVITGQPGCSGTTLEYTYTVVDDCGGTASDIQVITLDNDGPVIDCPETLNIINCEDGDYNALIDAWIASVTATAYCGGAVSLTNDFNGVNGLCITNGFTNVTFIATDVCGTTNTCIGTIIITDTEAPTIFQAPEEPLVPCNAATQSIFDNWLANRGGAEATDGCWGDDITWTMDPPNPTLDCDGGPQAIIVEFIATDGCGNSSSVTGIFNTKLQPDFVNISGQVFREDSEAVENVVMGFQGGSAGIPDIDYTGNTGQYIFPELEFEDNIFLVPEKNDDWTNGVTTFDLILMHLHILNIDTLDSPYKLIAADINRSGSITTIDMVHLRKLILAIDTEFQFNSSWRFVDAEFAFPNPENPFLTPFPEEVMISGLPEEELDFIGVKIGDVNLSAIPHSFMEPVDDRTGLDDLILEIEEKDLMKDEYYRIDFTSENFEQIDGFQFTISFDTKSLEVIDLESTDLDAFDEQNFGMSQLDKGAVTLSWNNSISTDLQSDEIVFSLLIKAKDDVQLSNVISITSQVTQAEAYQNRELMNVILNVKNDNQNAEARRFRLFQNIPNPFRKTTTIGFYLPERDVVRLEVFDASGKLIYEENDTYSSGFQQISVDRAELPVSGVLYYHVTTTNASESKKMILLD